MIKVFLMVFKKRVEKNSRLKAVSPLIATVLLVAVSLSIAGILYSWGQRYVSEETGKITEQTGQQIECTYAGIEILDCNYSNGYGLKFTLSSRGLVNLDENFTIVVIDAGNTSVEGTTDTDLAAGSAFPVNTNTFSDKFVNLQTPLARVRVIPADCPEKYYETTNC
ncbi:MAG: archaellin/type IV pilin N-terminal domain-containing protein [archaeon]